MTPRQSNTAQIRRELDRAFDDSALSAFCFDYFPNVYNKFSQGMSRNEKMTYLLDECRRHPTGFETLLDNVREDYRMSHVQREELKPLIDALSLYIGSSPRIGGTTKDEVGSRKETDSRITSTKAKVRETQPITTSPPANPFGYLSPVEDSAHYVVREPLTTEIINELRKGVNVSIVGDTHTGRTSLLLHICRAGAERLGRSAKDFVYLNLQEIQNEDNFFAELSHELGLSQTLRGAVIAKPA